MKKTLIILQIFIILILCGCEKDNELGDNDVIISFYTNHTEEKLYEITAEILNLEEENKSQTETAYGKNIKSAYANLMKNLNNVPYLGHAGILVFGDGLCKNGFLEAINFYSDINILSPNINIMFTEDDFSDFEPLSVYEASKNKTLTESPLYTLFIPENKTTLIPVIKATDGKPEKSGGIITENLKFKYYLDEDLCETYRLLTNTFNTTYYDSDEILKSKCKLKNNNGNLNIKLTLDIKSLNETDKEKNAEIISENIYNLTEKLKSQNLCNTLKKGDFDNVTAEIKLNIPDSGKLKGIE